MGQVLQFRPRQEVPRRQPKKVEVKQAGHHCCCPHCPYSVEKEGEQCLHCSCD